MTIHQGVRPSHPKHEPIPVAFTTDANGRVNSWNDPAERLFGYSPQEILGLSVSALFPDEVEQQAKTGAATTSDGLAPTGDRWCRRRDGTRVCARHAVVALRDASTIVGYVCLVRAVETPADDLFSAHQRLQAQSDEQRRQLAETSASLQVETAERRYSEEARLRLLRRLVIAQEEERRRIARDLHDHLGQQLTSLRLKIAAARRVAGPSAPAQEAFDAIDSMLEQVDRDVDFLSWELRPAALDDLGLVAVLENYVREWSHHSSISAKFHVDRLADERIAPEVEATLYRIAQEALNNVAKHSHAGAVSVLVEQQGRNISLVIEDNGVGLGDTPHAETHIGLHSMRERAAVVGGTLDVEPTPGGGTTVRARVPLFLVDVGQTLLDVPGDEASDKSSEFATQRMDTGQPTSRLQELQRGIAARDEFIATVAHELRNPIAPLMFQVRLAIDKTEQTGRAAATVSVEWAQSQLRRIEHRLHRLLETLDRLLDVSRLSTGRIDLALDHVDLVEVVQDVLATFEAELAVARCQVRLTAPSSVRGWWDRLRLDQICRNLISNAIRFGAGHPLDVTISADDDLSTLTVRDFGIGISEDQQDVIFERFERGSDANRSGGFGVGLWVVKTICAAMGGTIGVVSAVGSGATFTVTLPRRVEGTGRREVRE